MNAVYDPVTKAPSPLKGSNGRANVEPLSGVGVARQLPVTSVSASVALTAAVVRLSIVASGCSMRFAIGVGAQTAISATSHYIQQGERLDIGCAAGSTIAAIGLLGGTGTLEISELVA